MTDMSNHPMVQAIRGALILRLFNYVENIRTQGIILEFGVATGGTIRHIAEHAPSRRVYGFDSFEGLPEDWTGGGDGKGLPKGTFACDIPVDMPPNVTLIKGWFEDTLPRFVELMGHERVSLIHMDCDLGSSAVTVFKHIGSMVQNGTIIVFDEIMGYTGWEEGEFKAFNDFLEEGGWSWQCLGIHAGNLDDLEHAPEVKAGFVIYRPEQQNQTIVVDTSRA